MLPVLPTRTNSTPSATAGDCCAAGFSTPPMSAAGLGCAKTSGRGVMHRDFGEFGFFLPFRTPGLFRSRQGPPLGGPARLSLCVECVNNRRERLCPHRRQERLDTDDIHHSREIVSEHV